MKRTRKIFSALFALLLVGAMALTAGRPVAYAATLQEQLEEKQAQKAQYAQQIADAKAKKSDVLDQKSLMDQQNEVIRQEIDLVSTQIEDSNQQIASITQQIAENEEKEKMQYDLFCAQVRDEEERGTISYWAVLFKATSFADLLSRIDFINEIMEHDQSVIKTLRDLREQLAQDKTELETKKADLETQKETLNSSKAELEQQIAAAEQLVSEYESTQSGYQALYDAESAAAAEIENKIQAAERPVPPSGGSSSETPSSGGYIWPTDTRLVTSPFGPRESPGGIGSTYHLGVDIGASYGSSIYATKSGVVILTDGPWGGGYGNYVVVQHGDGNTTLYAHMSAILVSEGQTVSQGQVIGRVGSTGNSTGPHLHYEIREGGGRIDPLTYLPGYIPYDW